jgi:hypothetical protein
MSPARVAAPPGYVHAASDYGDEVAHVAEILDASLRGLPPPALVTSRAG